MDTNKKITMCILNQGAEISNPMSSEKQIAEGAENCSKIVNSNVEIDECTTADNDLQSGIPPVKMGLL